MCEASWRATNSGRSQRMRCNTLPLFTKLPRETVRKVSETLPAEPNGSPRSGFSVHFALRIAAKSSLGLLLVPFSDSLRETV